MCIPNVYVLILMHARIYSLVVALSTSLRKRKQANLLIIAQKVVVWIYNCVFGIQVC